MPIVPPNMDEYHTRTAHDERLAKRFASQTVPAPLHVYYHAALLAGWQTIVQEQMRLLAFCGLSERSMPVVLVRRNVSLK